MRVFSYKANIAFSPLSAQLKALYDKELCDFTGHVMLLEERNL
jgi:hypothetical protein